MEILSHPGHDYLEKSLRQGNWTLLKFDGKTFHFSSKKLLQFQRKEADIYLTGEKDNNKGKGEGFRKDKDPSQGG